MKNAAASRLVLQPYSEELVISTARQLLAELEGQVSCAFVFTSADYRENLPDFLELLQVHGHVPMVAGASGSGLVGTGVEAEETTGFSVLFLRLPCTKLYPCAIPAELLEESATPEDWHRALGIKADEVETWVVLGNPAGLPYDEWLKHWNAAFPGIPAVGGLASSHPDSHEFFVYQDHHIVESAVAIGFRGGVKLHTLVSQGCRPVGEPFTVTSAEDNIVLTLGSRPAYERLSETFDALTTAEKTRAAGNLFVGLALSEYVDEFKTGDFLVRNLIGADPESGAVAIGTHARVGQTLQFQLRDKRSANEDLHRLLLAKSRSGVKPLAALLFSCSGRGVGLFGVSNHDAMALQEHLGAAPTAGLFCNGEIGPVGGRNFIHGYTASIALFTDAE